MIRELLDYFDTVESLPIEVEAVRAHLTKIGPDDEITFHFVDMDPDLVRGVAHSYVRHKAVYGEPVNCTEICIAKEQPQHWRRIVAIKEMLHVIDGDAMTASQPDTVEFLFEALALPPEVRPDNHKNSYVNDKTRIYLALAVMIPKPFRILFRDLVDQKVLTAIDVARMSGVPARFIPLVLLPDFEDYIEYLITWEESHCK